MGSKCLSSNRRPYIFSMVGPSGNQASYPGNIYATVFPLSYREPQDQVLKQQQKMELPWGAVGGTLGELGKCDRYSFHSPGGQMSDECWDNKGSEARGGIMRTCPDYPPHPSNPSTQPIGLLIWLQFLLLLLQVKMSHFFIDPLRNFLFFSWPLPGGHSAISNRTAPCCLKGISVLLLNTSAMRMQANACSSAQVLKLKGNHTTHYYFMS